MCIFINRYLHLPLFCAERAWFYAMQLKSEANTEPRKKFHTLARIKKALFYAEEFGNLCDSPKCDARTKLESQVRVSTENGSITDQVDRCIYDSVWFKYIFTLSTFRHIYH